MSSSANLPMDNLQVRLDTHVIRGVVVVVAAGRLSDVVEELDHAIQLALAEGPRGVVCDLSGVLVSPDQTDSHPPLNTGHDAMPGHDGIELLATAGRHVRDWPGIPVAVVCPSSAVRDVLVAHPLGGQLIVAESLSSAVSAVLAAPTLAVQRLPLAPHPTAPRASRAFLTRTLLDWRLGRVIPFANLVVGELVASSMVHAGTDIDLSVAWDREALRLTVRDRGPIRPGQPYSVLGLHGRGLTVVAGLSRAFGVLPTADGGKVVWAVLDAVRPRPSTRRIRPERAIPNQESPVFTDGRGLAELPFCAGSRRQQAEGRVSGGS